MAGFIYIMSNPSFKANRLKIGKSERDPEAFRKLELETTGVPEPFNVEYYAYVDDFDEIERSIHDKLDHVRPNKYREFFDVSVWDAISLIRELATIRYEKFNDGSAADFTPTSSGFDHIALETTKGTVIIQPRQDLAPNHVARIKELVASGFYNHVPFHRVIDGLMAQTGDPTGTGMGGSGQKLNAEFNMEPHVRGTCSMARSQNPDSGDSQFFICFDNASFLDRQYTVWGQVVEGMENVDKIKRGEPVVDPDKIIAAKLIKYP